MDQRSVDSSPTGFDADAVVRRLIAGVLISEEQSVYGRATVGSLFILAPARQQELGERMQFPAESARKSAWQFLRCKVPRLDTLRRFAVATGLPIEELVAVPKEQGTRIKKKV